MLRGNVSGSCAGGLVGEFPHEGKTSHFGEGGTINNCYATGNVSGHTYAGGLVGYSVGSDYSGEIRISNCHATGNVTASSAGGLVGAFRHFTSAISHCYATGNVTSSLWLNYSSFAGGLVGEFEKGTISHCYATGNVVSSIFYGGGLVGGGGVVINNSYATGNVFSRLYAGGLMGDGGVINNCYATGNVSSSLVAGGLVGLDANISNSYATGNVSYSYPTTRTSSSTGGLVGKFKESIINNCYRNSDAFITKDSKVVAPDDEAVSNITPKTLVEMKTDIFKNMLNGTSGTSWGYSSGKNSDLPYLIGVGVGK